MGSLQTKNHKSNPNAKIIEGLKYKVRLLQKEVNEIMCIRENESEIYNQEMIIFALKEEEWKQEKKKLNEEVNDLKKKLEDYKEDEEKFRGVENQEMVSEKCDNKEFHMLVRNSLLEQIREEEVRRDEAIEKWKNLYFVIKNELDELIQRTNQGNFHFSIIFLFHFHMFMVHFGYFMNDLKFELFHEITLASNVQIQ